RGPLFSPVWPSASKILLGLALPVICSAVSSAPGSRLHQVLLLRSALQINALFQLVARDHRTLSSSCGKWSRFDAGTAWSCWDCLYAEPGDSGGVILVSRSIAVPASPAVPAEDSWGSACSGFFKRHESLLILH